MAKQSNRHFGGNKKVAPVGRGPATAPSGDRSVAAVPTRTGSAVATAIPVSRSAVKKGGGRPPVKAKQGANLTSSEGNLPK